MSDETKAKLEPMFETAMIEADSNTGRTCGSCGVRKPFSEFYKDGNDQDGNPKYRRDCKDCYRKTRLTERKAKRQPVQQPKKARIKNK